MVRESEVRQSVARTGHAQHARRGLLHVQRGQGVRREAPLLPPLDLQSEEMLVFQVLGFATGGHGI